MPDPAPDADAPASKSQMPWLITGSGGGFAVGLFTTLGVSDLFKSDKYAFALTTFGFVTCLILVIAIATVDMRTIPRRDGGSFAVGAWAAGVMAVVMLLVGFIGASMFFTDFWMNPTTPATAYYFNDDPDGGTPAVAPVYLSVNGNATPLAYGPSNTQAVEIARGAHLIVQVPPDFRLYTKLKPEFEAKPEELAANAGPQP